MTLPVGALRAHPDGELEVLSAAGTPAEAGDGVAAGIARLVTTHPVDPPGLTVARSPGAHPQSIAIDATESALGAGVDATNWNVIVADSLIVKIDRRWDGAHRAPGILAYLSEQAPGITPRHFGSVSMVIPGTTESAAVATVAEFVPGSVDGWTWVVDEACAAIDSESAATVDVSWASDLGKLVARLHTALREHPRARGTADASIEEADAALTREALATLAHLSTGDDETAARVRARRAALERAIRRTPAPRGPVHPIHGDLHVGQILRVPSGRLFVIDFDGDPQHPDSEYLSDAAVDLMHLVTSVDLVGAIVHRRRGGTDPRVDAWCDRSRAALLRAYEHAMPTEHTPATAARLEGLMVRRLIAELRYADSFLPRWRYAADYALTRRFTPEPHVPGDTAWTPPPSTTT
ncbi:MAG: hypothetical protein CMF57_07995 [Leifsonia sp.]|uniref:phosphotransferase n=1 Tax=Microcella pacifica TaxID=2591847 RepID=UPI000C63DFFA|nr:hypothetical protein [Leifsonia sp.]